MIKHCLGVKNPADALSHHLDYAPKEGEFQVNSLLPVLQEKLQQSLKGPECLTRPIQADLLAQGVVEIGSLHPTKASIEDSCDSNTELADEYCTNGNTDILDLLVPHHMVRAAMASETAYSITPKDSMIDLI